jgi:hypothetical protein
MSVSEKGLESPCCQGVAHSFGKSGDDIENTEVGRTRLYVVVTLEEGASDLPEEGSFGSVEARSAQDSPP